jgi:hypothetical protein
MEKQKTKGQNLKNKENLRKIILFLILSTLSVCTLNAQNKKMLSLMTMDFVLTKIDTSYKLDNSNNTYKNATKSSIITIEPIPQSFEESITEVVENGLPFPGKIWDHQLIEDGKQLYYIFKITPDKPKDYITFLLFKKLETGTVSVKADFPNYWELEEMNQLIEMLKSVQAVE